MSTEKKKTYVKTEVRKRQVLDMFAQGKSVKAVKDYLMNEIGLSKFTARDIINEVISEVMSEEYKEQLKASNLIRLDEIASDCINDGDRKNAIRAIDTLNKSIGAYTEKVEIQTDGEIQLNFNL